MCFHRGISLGTLYSAYNAAVFKNLSLNSCKCYVQDLEFSIRSHTDFYLVPVTMWHYPQPNISVYSFYCDFLGTQFSHSIHLFKVSLILEGLC